MLKSLLHSLRQTAWSGALAACAVAVMTPLQHARSAELVIATVNNGHMISLQKLAVEFERQRPDIRLRWTTLEESQLRQQLTRDITTGSARFDIMTIGAYEAPIWGRRGWLRAIVPAPGYEVDDLLPPIRQALSYEGKLYALPFYGESSMTLVRSDLLKAAGIELSPTPTWDQIREAARLMHAPDRGVYGICLRGKPGWGENMTLITTMVNAYGGQWFDMAWRPQLETAAWQAALNLYVELLTQYGPPGAAANGYNENLALFMAGRCAIWVDATVAGSFVNRTDMSTVAGKVAFLQAPTAVTHKGAHWLWTWALAIPANSRKADDAQAFIEWATSKAYIELVARDLGWAAVPSGTRTSTYKLGPFLRANAHARVELQAIGSAAPHDATLPRSPYVGVQFAAIPEFQSIGTAVGQQVSQLLQSKLTVQQALHKAQLLTERKMREAGYHARRPRTGPPPAPLRPSQERVKPDRPVP